MSRSKSKKWKKAVAFLRLCREEFHRSRGEEWANGITHLVGTIFSITALVLMVVSSAIHGTVWHVVSCSIYGTTLILLTLCSGLYHLLKGFRAKRVFQIFDHCTIYLLIAGTYMPFTFITMNHNAMGWTIFGIEWGLALCGVLVETLFPKIVKYASLPIYLIMGWLLVIDLKGFLANIPTGGLVMLTVGGLLYTLGVIFYLMDYTPYMHTIWHLFVLGGIVCQWVCIMFWVIPSFGA